MSTLRALQDWYLSQCNEDWEHEYGVEIGTLDNPGWSLKVDLVDTDLSGKTFPGLEYGVGEDSAASGNNWITCRTEKDQFIAHGGPEKLEEMISVFLAWAAKAA